MQNIFEIKDNFQTCKNTSSILVSGDFSHCPAPQVSVVMPVYNHPDFLRVALKSALDQDYRGAYEIIVVDNDDSVQGESPNFKVIREFNAPHVYYYRNQVNIGMFGNWNRCIELARAPFLVFCHDDDMLLPNALSRLMNLQKKSGNKAIFSAFNKINGKGEYIKKKKVGKKILGILKKKDHYNYAVFAHFMDEVGNGVGSLFSKECLLEIGGFNPEFYPVADYALFSHYTYRFGALYNTVPTFNYRIAENETFNCYREMLEMDKYIWTCMKEAIALPDRFLDRIIQAKYNTRKIRFDIEFGHKDKSLKKSLKTTDKLLLKMIHWAFFFKRYGF